MFVMVYGHRYNASCSEGFYVSLLLFCIDGGGYHDSCIVFLRASLVIACCCTRLAEIGGSCGTNRAEIALLAICIRKETLFRIRW